MGALPRLKKKVEYQYRKGSTNESRNCKWCASFVKEMTVDPTRRSKGLEVESRCKLFGLAQSRRYRVREDYTCNAQQSTYRPPKFLGEEQ